MNTENVSEDKVTGFLPEWTKKYCARELTHALNTSSQDDLAESAPGSGYTAQLALSLDLRS